eukprot:gnl/Trimastix_PCT/1388.p1 GENE.gnl/Trimastix_PCT/1388~~gnl/Trimastix_PCT/1388.p1  ORF type:complete len:646 (+),score=108.99 gnl/Trimastix_PCT/1388:35-1939(+)
MNEKTRICVTRKRRDFWQEAKFSDRDGHGWVYDLTKTRDSISDTTRALCDFSCDVPRTTESSVQTDWWPKVNMSMQTQPIDIPQKEKNAALHSQEMFEFLDTVSDRMRHALEQNATVDIFRDHFANLPEDDLALGQKGERAFKDPHTLTNHVYTRGKSVAFIDWVPGSKCLFAVSCVAPLSFEERVLSSGMYQNSYIVLWNVHDIHPQCVLECPADCFVFRFHPTRPHVIAGGCLNGQVLLWDLSSFLDAFRSRKRACAPAAQPQGQAPGAAPGQAGGGAAPTSASATGALPSGRGNEDGQERVRVPVFQPVRRSSIERGHRGCVGDIRWAQDQSNTFYSVGLDGQLFHWAFDSLEPPPAAAAGREARWMPQALLPLYKPEWPAPLGATRLCLMGEKGIMLGTEDGELVTGSLDALAPLPDPRAADDVQPTEHPVFATEVRRAHHGSVIALERCPLCPQLVLSAGGWSFAVWKEGTTEPIFVSPFLESMIHTACWSPTRFGLIVTALNDSTVQVWNLLDQTHRPAIANTFGGFPIPAISFNPYLSQDRLAQYLTFGNQKGTTFIIEMSRNYSRMHHAERAQFDTFLKREGSRIEGARQRSEQREELRKEQERLGILSDGQTALAPEYDGGGGSG